MEKLKNRFSLRLKPFSLREKRIFLGVVSVVSFAIVYLGVVQPVLDFFLQTEQEIKRKSVLVKKYARLVGEKDLLLNLSKNYQDVLAQKQDPELIVADLFKEVESLGRQFKVNIEKIRPIPIEKKGKFKVIGLEVEVSAGFSSLFQFIHALDYSPSFLRIYSLQMYPQRDKGGLYSRIEVAKIVF